MINNLKILLCDKGHIRIALKNKLVLFDNKKERIGKFIIEYPYRPYFYGLYHEIFIEENYEIGDEFECKNIIDAGANIGVSVIYFASKYPEANIQCFEPNPSAVKYLSRNISNNNINAKINPFALGSENRKITFFVDKEIEGSSIASRVKLMDSKNRPSAEITVEMRKLSDFIGDKTIDILKLDIEGGEVEVIEDLVSTNKIKMIKRMFIEFHYDPKSLPQSLPKFLELLEKNSFFYYISKGANIKISKRLTHSYIIFAFQ